MSRIELSEEQKVKLEKMCFDLIVEHDRPIQLEDGLMLFVNETGAEFKIHWFELCVVELPKRIAESYNTAYPKDKHAFIVDMMIKKILDFSYLIKVHPVDYLFEIYEKTL